MKKYKYSFFAKLFFRYGNIPLTVLLLIYLAASIIGIMHEWYFTLFAAINLVLIIWLNKYYIKTYKQFPFIISADNEKLICSDFFLSEKVIEIEVKDIDKISGGIFSGYQTRATYIHDAKQNITIGFYSNSGRFNEMLTAILKNINEELYQQLKAEIKKIRDGK